MILLSTLGVWTLILLITAARLRRSASAEVLAFPFVVLANYLVLSTGLASGDLSIQNRPFVWAYFAIVVWSAGGLWFALFGDRAPSVLRWRAAAGLALLASLAVPAFFARDLQTLPVWRGLTAFEEFAAVPTCLLEAADLIRERSSPDELVQASNDDPQSIVAAFTERQPFALDNMHGYEGPSGLAARLAELASLRRLTDGAAVTSYAVGHDISWYLLDPASQVSWPPSLLDQAAFECGGYRVFHFGRGPWS
jgi:hypothetical protein